MPVPSPDLLQAWPELDRLLDEALEIDPGQRPGWLAQRTDLTPALRARLARLFERDAAGGTRALAAGWAVPPGDAVDGSADAPAATSPLALEAGARVGPWCLVRELGRGGMSTVWLAERVPDATGPVPSSPLRVALKLPHLSWTAALAERLERERSILATLRHPHIARLLDAGVDGFGRPWLALEVVDGEPIDAWCAQRAAPLRLQLELLAQVADAVGFAHARGIVHRDLKPSNVLVSSDGQAHLLDFGIAKLMHEGLTADTALTRDAGRALTPEYASPEQISGQPLGAASDVYSLGVLAFELLAGERPYKLPMRSAALETALAAIDVPLASRRARDPERSAALRGDLDAIVSKALQPEPAGRYASGDALADDLRRYLRGEPVRARPIAPPQRVLRWMVRHRMRTAVAVAALAVTVLALSAGATTATIAALATAVLLALWQGSLARRRAADAERQAARARAAQRFLEGLFEPISLARGDASTRERLSADDLLLRAADQLVGSASGEAMVASFGGDAELTADLQGVLGRLLHEHALTDRAVELRSARVLLLQRLGASAFVRAQALTDLAESLAARGDLAKADARMDAALTLLRSASGQEAEAARARFEAQRAGLRLQHTTDADAMAALERAITALRQLAPGSAELADALAMHATALSEHQHQTDAAYAVAQEAIALLEQRSGQRLRAAQLRHRIAALLFVQRHYDEADEQSRRAYETFRRIAGARHPTAAVVGVARARMLTIHGRLDESLPLLRECVPVLEAAAARIDPGQLGEAQMAFGEALLEEGRVAEALPALERALATLRAAGPPIPRTVAALLLARAQAEAGRLDEALALLQETMATRIELWGQEHPSTALVMQRIGSTHGAAGRYDEAAHWLLRVAGTADVREHSFGSVKHRAAASLVAMDVDRGRCVPALAAATALRDEMLALPPEQRTRALRLSTELTWLRARLGCGQVDGLDATFAALMALSAPLYEGAPLRLAVRAVRVCWLAALGRTDEARSALAEVEAGFALQPLGPQFTRLLAQARSSAR